MPSQVAAELRPVLGWPAELRKETEQLGITARQATLLWLVKRSPGLSLARTRGRRGHLAARDVRSRRPAREGRPDRARAFDRGSPPRWAPPHGRGRPHAEAREGAPPDDLARRRLRSAAARRAPGGRGCDRPAGAPARGGARDDDRGRARERGRSAASGVTATTASSSRARWSPSREPGCRTSPLRGSCSSSPGRRLRSAFSRSGASSRSPCSGSSRESSPTASRRESSSWPPRPRPWRSRPRSPS